MDPEGYPGCWMQINADLKKKKKNMKIVEFSWRAQHLPEVHELYTAITLGWLRLLIPRYASYVWQIVNVVFISGRSCDKTGSDEVSSFFFFDCLFAGNLLFMFQSELAASVGSRAFNILLA